jgi:hypothetical protein
MTELFVPHNDYIALINIIENPVYLTEPLVRSVSYRKRGNEFKWVRYNCEVYERSVGTRDATME